MEIQDKYLPEVERRVDIVNAQIAESKTILFRYVLSRDEADDSGNSKQVLEDEFNMRTIIHKIDFLTSVLDNLSK